jgi:hypothetical protein
MGRRSARRVLLAVIGAAGASGLLLSLTSGPAGASGNTGCTAQYPPTHYDAQCAFVPSDTTVRWRIHVSGTANGRIDEYDPTCTFPQSLKVHNFFTSHGTFTLTNAGDCVLLQASGPGPGKATVAASG